MDFSYCGTGYYPLNMLSITIISVTSCEMTFLILQTTSKTCCKTETGFQWLPKKFMYLVWCLVCCVKGFYCNGFIFVIRTILCCNVRSLLAAPSRFWVLFCVLFLSMCLCKLQIRAGCSELLQLKSMSLAWCVLHLEEVLEGLVFLWLPWATQEHRCLTQCWVSLRKQNASSWALSMFCVLKHFLRVSCR